MAILVKNDSPDFMNQIETFNKLVDEKNMKYLN